MSNLNMIKETVFLIKEVVDNKPIYISEDALLEQPQLVNNNIINMDLSAEIDKEDYEETSRLFNSPASSSNVSSSFVSDYTEFSGFETDLTQDSFIIPPINPIYVTESLSTITSGDENSNSTEQEEFESKETKERTVNHNSLSVLTNVTNINNTERPSVKKPPEITPTSNSIHNPICVTESLSTITSGDENSNFTEQAEFESKEIKESNVNHNCLSVLTNVTNINNTKRPSVKKPPEITPTTNSIHDKENIYYFTQPTPPKKYKNFKTADISPDLFSNEDELVNAETSVTINKRTINEKQLVLKNDQKLIKNVQSGLIGVLPPPSVTTLQFSVVDMLNRIKSNGDYFWSALNKSESDMDISFESKSLLVSGSYECCVNNEFPAILDHRFHGLHHNRSKLSEEFEHLCDKYSQRHVGSETQSSCTVFELNGGSPSKRKINKQRWSAKSPGRRLSHLARRRITFSSSNIQNASSSFVGSRTRQILVDAKKLELLNRKKSPKKTPKKSMSKSPVKTRTPSSTAKKKLAMRFRMLTGEIEDSLPSVKSVKTHIFEETSKSSYLKPISNNTPLEVKRNLFNSISNVTLNSSPTKKRKHCGNEDCPPSKLPKVASFQGKCSENDKNLSLNRTRTEPLTNNTSQVREMTDSQKKKLQWVVYETLRSQNVNSSHANFKVYASTLARVIRRFLPFPLNVVGSVSAAMLKIARTHIYSVMKGKTVDEIINEYLHSRAMQKNKGSVKLDNKLSSNKENVYHVNRNTENINENIPFKNDNSINVSRIRKVINFGEDNR